MLGELPRRSWSEEDRSASANWGGYTRLKGALVSQGTNVTSWGRAEGPRWNEITYYLPARLADGHASKLEGIFLDSSPHPVSPLAKGRVPRPGEGRQATAVVDRREVEDYICRAW